MTICEWCGHDHPQTALCTERPKWSRRGFLSLCGAGLVGLALPLPAPEPEWIKGIVRSGVLSFEINYDPPEKWGHIVSSVWMPSKYPHDEALGQMILKSKPK